MSVTFAPAGVAALPAELVEKYGWPPVSISHLSDDEVGAEVCVHMHNDGAQRSLAALGIEHDPADMYGEMAPEDFLGRVLVALAIAPEDEGAPAYRAEPGELTGLAGMLAGAGATVWVGASAPGDLQRRLTALRELAEFCCREGYLVAWA